MDLLFRFLHKVKPTSFILLFLALAVVVAGSGASLPVGSSNLLQADQWNFRLGPGQSNRGPGGQDNKSGLEWRQSDSEFVIRKVESDTDVHVWWWQRRNAVEGAVHRLTFEAKGTGGENHHVYAGVDFLDADGKNVGYKQLVRVCYINPKWPGATVADVNDWKTFTADFTMPRGATAFSIRLALGAVTPAEAAFRNITVTSPSMPVAEALARLPQEIPVARIPLDPVAAGGVTLTPDWRTEGAEQVQSEVRMRLCLNGLWAIQPATKFSAPKADDWAFMKVPNALMSGHPFSAYGEERTSWKGLDLYSKAEAIWLVRDVTIPFMDLNRVNGNPIQRKVYLELSTFRGFSLAVFWNGKRIGMLLNQQGERLDLSSVAQPGDKGQLAIYALANPPESRYAYLMETGRMTRFYDSTRFAREKNRSNYERSLADVYLQIEPADPVFVAPKITPSIRKQTLGIEFANAQLIPTELAYSVEIRGAQGELVLKQDGLHAQRRGDVWNLEMPWEAPRLWTPDDPYMHRVSIRASDANGRIVDDTLPISFGFREVWVDGKNLMMNGHALRLRPRLSFTYSMDGAAMRRQISHLKDMGFNCIIRPGSGTTHGLESEERQFRSDFYTAADEMGIFVVPYTPYNLASHGQFGDSGTEVLDLDALMLWLREKQVEPLFNHPSVIAYSGFGGGASEGINYIYCRPDTWGITPFDQDGVLERTVSSPENRTKTLEMIRRSRDYIQRFKELDPTRPFLSHNDTGLGDGWGTFDYFNWTPLQEWEDWPKAWAINGVMPIGSTEHGLPYPSTFLNHAIPDGDNEPWVTEYSAMLFGVDAYNQEESGYLDFIRSSYNPRTKAWPPKTSAHHYFAEEVVSKSPLNVQEVWSANNRAIYRAWRTYGVPMGIEPFGRLQNLVEYGHLRKKNGNLVADASQELRTTGAKLDRWNFNAYWPSETMPGLPESPTGRMPENLTPLGRTLYEVNSPLLVYLGGSSVRVTAKDHVFTTGEKVSKQIVVVWDGFHDRTLELEWKALLDGRIVAEGRNTASLNAGDIRFYPVEFQAPAVSARSEGEIEVTVFDVKRKERLPGDHFAFQVYPPLLLGGKARTAKIVLFDPAGESSEALGRLGIKPIVSKQLSEWNGGDILVVGRRGLAEFGRQSLQSVPSSVPVLLLEQEASALENFGLRAYPARHRMVFPLVDSHPVMRGIGTADLRNWRVSSTLLPEGVEPLRSGYNYHTDYYGTVTSVSLETPTRGNFTPLLQCGFDLRETPLLEARLGGRQWVFCQLSMVDGLPESSSNAGDPVGSRILVNLIDYLLDSRDGGGGKPAAFAVLGGQEDVNLAAELGSSVSFPTLPQDLVASQVALVGNEWGANSKVLQDWVRKGGSAVVLPQAKGFYSDVLPFVSVREAETSLSPLPAGPTFRGLGPADFHSRQPLSVLTFNGKATAAEIADGKGRWILLGFDPRTLDMVQAPWLRLTIRHQYRALAQILTNLGVILDVPAQAMLAGQRSRSFKLDLVASSAARLRASGKVQGDAWIKPEFEDSQWTSFGLASQVTGFGDACVRIHFSVPKDVVDAGLVASLGTMDDYDETWLNGVRIGSIGPDNSQPDQAWKTQRMYEIPAGLLRSGATNVLAIRVWNRNAATKGWPARVRGPLLIRNGADSVTPYVGDYRHSDDPYLQHHW